MTPKNLIDKVSIIYLDLNNECILSPRGQQHHYGNSHRNQAESNVNGDGSSRSKSVEDCITFENVPQTDELPPGACEGQQEFPAPPVGVA